MTENESQIAAFSADTENPETARDAYPNPKSLTGLFFALTLISLCSFLFWPLLFGNLKTWDGPSWVKLLLRVLSFAFMYILMIAYAIRRNKKKLGYFDGISWKKIPYWLIPLIIIGAVSLCFPEQKLSAMIPMLKIFRKAFSQVFSKDLSSVIIAVIFAPVAEEILFRGIILRGLLKNYSPLKAIVISAVFFALMHLNPWQAVPALLGGVFLGWIYFKTDSIIPGIIIHATTNACAMALFFFPSYLSHLHNPLILFIAIFIFATTCFVIQKNLSNSRPDFC